MLHRLRFFAIATLVIWLVICLPLTILGIWLSNLSTGSAIQISVLIALPLALYMWFSIQSATLAFKWPALQLLGLTTILISALLVTTPLHLFLHAFHVGVIALLLWLALSVFAAWKANSVADEFLSIRSPKLSRQHRFVHLSDVHAGSRSSSFIHKVVSQANSHQPDFVVITGDLLDSSQVDGGFLSALARFNCPVWMCLGNHERYVNLANAINAIEQQGVTVLRNKTDHHKELLIVGVDDTDNPADAANSLSAIPIAPDQFSILLYHRPDGWQAAQDNKIDLMLAGHTHAGQIWPFGLLVKRQFPQMAGYFEQQQSRMFVSQGTGTWGPTLRLGTQCEMVVIDLLPTQ